MATVGCTRAHASDCGVLIIPRIRTEGKPYDSPIEEVSAPWQSAPCLSPSVGMPPQTHPLSRSLLPMGFLQRRAYTRPGRSGTADRSTVSKRTLTCFALWSQYTVHLPSHLIRSPHHPCDPELYLPPTWTCPFAGIPKSWYTIPLTQVLRCNFDARKVRTPSLVPP